MKKTILSLLMGSAAVSLQAEDIVEQTEVYQAPVYFVPSHHEIKPQFHFLRHSETNYRYSKFLGGVEYKYFKAEGPNFSAFMGYSHTDHKSYFSADWKFSYVFQYDDFLNIYPIIGFGNSSHFAATPQGNDYQIFCSKLNTGVGATYFWNTLLSADLTLSYFKDVASSVIVYKGDDFWGKRYHSPYGLKAALELKFPNIMSKDIVVGGFYAQTIKKGYREYGLNTAVVFAF